MITLMVKADTGIPPPRCEIFKLVAKQVSLSLGLSLIDTGLVFKLPHELSLEVTGIGNIVIAHTFDGEGRLRVLTYGVPVEGEPFAIAEILERKPSRVRFIIRTEEGTRMVTGEAQVKTDYAWDVQRDGPIKALSAEEAAKVRPDFKQENGNG